MWPLWVTSSWDGPPKESEGKNEDHVEPGLLAGLSIGARMWCFGGFSSPGRLVMGLMSSILCEL